MNSPIQDPNLEKETELNNCYQAQGLPQLGKSTKIREISRLNL